MVTELVENIVLHAGDRGLRLVTFLLPIAWQLNVTGVEDYLKSDALCHSRCDMPYEPHYLMVLSAK